jgi:hypothetical protein
VHARTGGGGERKATGQHSMGMEEVGCGRAVHEGGGGGREDWPVRRGTVRREIVVKVGTKQQWGASGSGR